MPLCKNSVFCHAYLQRLHTCICALLCLFFSLPHRPAKKRRFAWICAKMCSISAIPPLTTPPRMRMTKPSVQKTRERRGCLSDPTEIPPYRETGVAIPLSHCVSCGIADYCCYTPTSFRKNGLSQALSGPDGSRHSSDQHPKDVNSENSNY